jgi:hypothetical protein
MDRYGERHAGLFLTHGEHAVADMLSANTDHVAGVSRNGSNGSDDNSSD